LFFYSHYSTISLKLSVQITMAALRRKWLDKWSNPTHNDPAGSAGTSAQVIEAADSPSMAASHFLGGELQNHVVESGKSANMMAMPKVPHTAQLGVHEPKPLHHGNEVCPDTQSSTAGSKSACTNSIMGARNQFESHVWVGKIPIAPKPAKSQLQESRWATMPRQAPPKVLDPKAKGDSYTSTKEDSHISHPRRPRHSVSKLYLQSKVEKSTHPSENESKLPPHLRHEASRPTHVTKSVSLASDKNKVQNQSPVGLVPKSPKLLLPKQETFNTSARTSGEKTINSKENNSLEDAQLVTHTTIHSTSSANAGDFASRPHDIRGEEPPELYDEQDWNAPRRTRNKRKEWESETVDSNESVKSNVSQFMAPTSLDRYIRFWHKDVPELKIAAESLQRFDNQKHEIDLLTGKLLPMVENEYPTTTYDRKCLPLHQLILWCC
jgi:hypothetical protein